MINTLLLMLKLMLMLLMPTHTNTHPITHSLTLKIYPCFSLLISVFNSPAIPLTTSLSKAQTTLVSTATARTPLLAQLFQTPAQALSRRLLLMFSRFFVRYQDTNMVPSPLLSHVYNFIFIFNRLSFP